AGIEGPPKTAPAISDYQEKSSTRFLKNSSLPGNEFKMKTRVWAEHLGERFPVIISSRPGLEA
ncbi:MAG: hypothetical protein V3S39_01650, partial [Thermodesulfobacteriota bacterium]